MWNGFFPIAVGTASFPDGPGGFEGTVQSVGTRQTSSDVPLEVFIVNHRCPPESRGQTSPLLGREQSVAQVGCARSVPTPAFLLFLGDGGLRLICPAAASSDIGPAPSVRCSPPRKHLLAVDEFLYGQAKLVLSLSLELLGHGRVAVLMGVSLVRGQLQSLGEVLAAGLHNVHGSYGVAARTHTTQGNK